MLQLGASVSREKFEEVCIELQTALDREQEAERLLTEQAQQIQDISSRLDKYTSGGALEKSVSDLEKVVPLSSSLKYSRGDRGTLITHS